MFFPPLQGGLLVFSSMGLRDTQLCLMCFQLASHATVFTPHRGEHWVSCWSWQPHMFLLFTADERQMTVGDVSISRLLPQHPRLRGMKTGRILLHINPDGWLQFQKPHCHSLTFHKPPSESLLIWVMLTEMRIGAIWNSDASLDDQL